MSKVLTSLMAVVLVSTVAVADISQTQNFLSGLANSVNLVQCETQANSCNSLILDNKQCAIGGCATSADQFQVGVFNQSASGSGLCATVGVLQEVAAAGQQVQLIGNGVGPKGQQEVLTLSAGEAVTKQNGQGTGSGSQLVALSQGQTGTNAAGTVSQSSAVVSTQGAFVNGIPTAVGQAGSTTQVSTSQTQLVN
jgi:hypothetical protein